MDANADGESPYRSDELSPAGELDEEGEEEEEDGAPLAPCGEALDDAPDALEAPAALPPVGSRRPSCPPFNPPPTLIGRRSSVGPSGAGAALAIEKIGVPRGVSGGVHGADVLAHGEYARLASCPVTILTRLRPKSEPFSASDVHVSCCCGETISLGYACAPRVELSSFLLRPSSLSQPVSLPDSLPYS